MAMTKPWRVLNKLSRFMIIELHLNICKKIFLWKLRKYYIMKIWHYTVCKVYEYNYDNIPWWSHSTLQIQFYAYIRYSRALYKLSITSICDNISMIVRLDKCGAQDCSYIYAKGSLFITIIYVCSHAMQYICLPVQFCSMIGQHYPEQRDAFSMFWLDHLSWPRSPACE